MSYTGDEYSKWPGRFLEEPEASELSLVGWPPDSFKSNREWLMPRSIEKGKVMSNPEENLFDDMGYCNWILEMQGYHLLIDNQFDCEVCPARFACEHPLPDWDPQVDDQWEDGYADFVQETKDRLFHHDPIPDQAIDYERQDFEYDAQRERAALKKVYRD